MILLEADEDALDSEISALGHLGKAEAVPILLPYVTSPSSRIRATTTYALGSFVRRHAEAVDALVKLSSDTDRQIRNWSTFYIGTQSDFDSPAIREALARRLADSFSHVREEAIAGLAKRKDERAARPLLGLLKHGSYFVFHEYDFEQLLEADRPSNGWSPDLLIEALLRKFPSLSE